MMYKFHNRILQLTSIILLLSSCYQVIPQTKEQRIDELLNVYYKQGSFNGSVLVAHEGKVIYKKGFGLANMEWDIPNEPNTKHRLGSLTKQFTAMLIVQLAAEGKLDLHAPISTYLPDYPKKNGEKITIHHLLTHSSGTPSYTSIRNFWDIQRDYHSHDQMLALFADSTLHFTPGDKFEYSNSGYYLLGVIIEAVKGKRYEEVMQERVFDPLDMNDSGYDRHHKILKNRATGYRRERVTREFSNAQFLDMSMPYAAGALYSTVEDLYKWGMAMNTEKLMPKEFMDLIFYPHFPDGDGFYAYGWGVDSLAVGNTSKQVLVNGHYGGINGFHTRIARIPSNNSLIVLLSNIGGSPLNSMGTAINGILHDTTYDFPKASVAHGLMEVVKKEGIEKGVTFFYRMKDNEDYYLDEGEMNLAGYGFLEVNPESSAAIFKLNVEAFPESFNVYDSYGEALLILGRREEAITNYKKSIELNPDNENGISVLKELGEVN